MQATREVQVLKNTFAQFGHDYVARNAKRCYSSHAFDHESWFRLAELGFWRIAIPKELGGEGLTWWEFVLAFEALSQTSRDLGFSLSIIAHAGFLRSLLQFGTPEQKAVFLPRLLSGDIGATAMTEHTGGSDVSRIKTQAELINGQYVINGEKWHITNAPVATLIMVLARIPSLGHKKDITIFMVERGTPGLSHGEAEDMLGNHTSPTGNLYLKNVHASPNHVIGVPGDGLNTIYNTISLDRLLYGILAASYLEPILHEVMSHTHEREAFGEPIANFQYVQGRITEIKIALETTRSISYTALSQLLSGDSRAVTTCSIAKLIGSEALAACTQHAMRLYGHIGYMNGDIANSVKDALGTVIAGGTSEMQRKNIFNQMRREMHRQISELPANGWGEPAWASR